MRYVKCYSGLIILSLFVVCFESGCDSENTCSVDGDCKESRVCIDGVCQDPGSDTDTFEDRTELIDFSEEDRTELIDFSDNLPDSVEPYCNQDSECQVTYDCCNSQHLCHNADNPPVVCDEECLAEAPDALCECGDDGVCDWVTGTIEGVVYIVEGPPEEPVWTGLVEGATVTAWQDGGVLGSTTTDEQGYYNLELPEGVYLVTAERYPRETAAAVADVEVPEGVVVVLDLTIYSTDMDEKPNIYLYPEETTQVSVEVELCYGCYIVESIPEYGQGWDVHVEPDGLIDGLYTYLYYESTVPRNYPMDEGWSVAEDQLPIFFNDTLGAYGFTLQETLDFVDYWTQTLEFSPYYAVYPLVDPVVLDQLEKLWITPVPDSLFRVRFVIQSLQEPISLPTPEIDPMIRQGFSVVEWGVIRR